MKINKEAIERLAALDDRELWLEIKKIAGEYGIKLTTKEPSHEELEKIRAIVRGGNLSMTDAMRLVSEYKKKYGV